MRKIKEWFSTNEDFGGDDDFVTKKEILYFIGMYSGWVVAITLGLFAWIFMTMSGD